MVIGEAWRVDIPNMADPTGTFDEITAILRVTIAHNLCSINEAFDSPDWPG